ncbi:hypothetical protein [Rhodococcus opacus]|uniref:Uncharacterized protein n=1 Tax=Rhodococcus opacus TaxID=37919 RepID=A0AAX3Y9R5_RHOOP|nr:hypothetical protein [Rhodococcus opacus]MCZ4586398.1 hypothetical protein [Rhodococcus opacus]WLF44842.1 hypothetical protein Q5707_23345 [Rhodococcus opacus]
MRQPAPRWASAMTAGCHLLRNLQAAFDCSSKELATVWDARESENPRQLVVETLDLTDITPVAPQEKFVSTRGPVEPTRRIETGDHVMTIGVVAQIERSDSASRVDSATTMHPESGSGVRPSHSRAVGRYREGAR